MSDFFWDINLKKQILPENILNSVIEGDNLSVLNLLKKYYTNKIKLIYIDPPYNTKRKFVYLDNYGSHKAWLEMMKPRLLLARDLLKDDGFVFVSIDDNEVHYLRILMDEVFGEENFRNCIVTPRGRKNVQAQFSYSDRICVGHEYVVFYSKKKESRIRKFEKPRLEIKQGGWNNHWRGTDRPNLRYELFGILPESGQWRWSRERSLRAIQNYKRMQQELGAKNKENNFITQAEIDNWYCQKQQCCSSKYDLLRLSKHGKPEHYVPPSRLVLGDDLWLDIKPTGLKDLKSILPHAHFDMPKPVALIGRIVNLVTDTNKNDIILDFFAGSGTTGQAVLEENANDCGNRKFILVQLPERSILENSTKGLSIAELCYQRVCAASEKFNLVKNEMSYLKLCSD